MDRAVALASVTIANALAFAALVAAVGYRIWRLAIALANAIECLFFRKLR
jgi:hypothetical protein